MLQSPQQVDLLVLIAPTAVLPEGYTLPVVAPDQIATLLFAHPENMPAQPRGGPGTRGQGDGAGSTSSRVPAAIGSWRTSWARSQTQTLVVFGTADKVVPPAMGRTYRERMPNCHFVMVYDAGHAVAQRAAGGAHQYHHGLSGSARDVYRQP